MGSGGRRDSRIQLCGMCRRSLRFHVEAGDYRIARAAASSEFQPELPLGIGTGLPLW